MQLLAHARSKSGPARGPAQQGEGNTRSCSGHEGCVTAGMRNRGRLDLRLFGLIALLGLVAVVFGCTGGDAAPLPDVRREVALKGSATAFAHSQPPASPVDVVGTVATDHSHAVRGRAVVLVDALRKRYDQLTDDMGRFSAPGIVPPYDLAVAGVTEGATVALGLSRSDPYVEVPERLASPPVGPHQTVRLAVKPKADMFGSVEVVTLSSSGGARGRGRSTVELEPGSRKLDIDVVHAWRDAAPLEEETLDVHVLVAHGDAASFEYARVRGVRAVPGSVSDVGVVDVVDVPLGEPIAFGARSAGLQHLRFRSTLAIDVEGALFTIAACPQASGSVRPPTIPGMLVRSEVTASQPRGNAGGIELAEVWSGNAPVESRSLERDIALGPELRRPEIGGTLPRSSRGFAWRRPTHGAGLAPALATLTVADTKRNVVRFRVRTNDDEVPFDRLRMLGIPKLLGGDHTLELATDPGVSLEALYSPEPQVRWAHLDRTRAGGRTSLQTPFRVAH
jgi:hypothetical protein